jgi:hypothetical protein
VINCLKAAATGTAAGFCLAFMLSRFIWLDMRVTTGHAIPLTAAVFTVVFGAAGRPVAMLPFLLLEVLAAVIFCAAYGLSLSAATIVPAALFRDGFHLGALSLGQINAMLLCLLGAANLGWIYHAACARKGRTKG